MLRFKGDLDADDPRFNLLWGAGCSGLQQDGTDVVAYFDTQKDVPVEGRWEDADATDYVERYHANLHPVDVGPLVVAPTHREVTLKAYQRVVWLDPGLAFGSGHHATTRMALMALAEHEPFDLDVLDVGTGSGVLALAAAVLGARSAVGVDIDSGAIDVARENARRNGVTAQWHVGSLDVMNNRPFDVIVANLYAELHAELAADFDRVAKRGSLLIVTGILSERESVVTRAFQERFRLLARQRDDEWVCLTWCKD
jgi:ribosomal protein L11 methyltransferase